MAPNFDRIARPYRMLEYLTLGRSLERCRLHFLPQLSGKTHALVLGDGDGRFLAALLARNPALSADAVDTSAAMLNLLRTRCERTVVDAETRLRTYATDALSYITDAPPVFYDLVVTHFFLDCFTQGEVEALVSAISSRVAPGAIWVVSDFRIPTGPMRYPARLIVRALYLGFRILTGLRTTCLPDHTNALASSWVRTMEHHPLYGMLIAELWALNKEEPTENMREDIAAR